MDLVSLLVTHYCATMGALHTGIAMTVTSARNAPTGSGYLDGITVGEFTQPTGGTVVIHAYGQQNRQTPHTVSGGRGSRPCCVQASHAPRGS